MKRLIAIFLFSLVSGFFITYTSDLSSVKDLLTKYPCSDCGMQVNKGWPLTYYSVFIPADLPIQEATGGTFFYPYFYIDILVWTILVSGFIQILLSSKFLKRNRPKRFLRQLAVSFMVVIALGYWQYLLLILDSRYPAFQPTLSNAPTVSVILIILLTLTFLVAGFMRLIEFTAEKLKL